MIISSKALDIKKPYKDLLDNSHIYIYLFNHIILSYFKIEM